MWSSAVLFLALLVSTAGATSLKKSRPNIVVLLADDTGYGDLSSYGNTAQEFGHIDAMANEGIRFTQWFAGESLCTPSRTTILTGRLAARVGMIPAGTGTERVLGPTSTGGLPRDEVSIAKHLQDAGYATGIVGKWHQGINRKTSNDNYYSPANYGFDHVGLNLPFSNHWACDETGRHMSKPNPRVCFLYNGSTIYQQPIDHSHLSENFAMESVNFIKANAQARKPFFLFHAFAHQHVSMFTSSQWTNSSANGIYGSNMREMDASVGIIRAGLQEAGVENDTIIFFTSDHGPHIELCSEGGNAGPLRGGKAYSSWEGGVRVPGIVTWPGTVSPAVTSTMVSSMDIVATAVDLATGSVPDNLDGNTILPLLEGNSSYVPHDALFHYCSSRLMAIRYGPYKIRTFVQNLPTEANLLGNCPAGSPNGEYFTSWDCFGSDVQMQTPPQLLKVESDPGEHYPLPFGNGTCTGRFQTIHDQAMDHNSYAVVSGNSSASCMSICCGDPSCGSFVYNATSRKCTLNALIPQRLVSAEGVDTVVLDKTFSGPYGPLMASIMQAATEHFGTMTFAPPQLSQSDKSVTPCCNPPQCTCNYPGPTL